ncbi:xyloside xylosyltransferase 1 isoform X3 [Zophobas morio]|uniref:xyloside xylosyltransferase 1 isoform X3 n=1 Tax=Zophobas morio TaxID=2755281 RepID=UPI003082EC08
MNNFQLSLVKFLLNVIILFGACAIVYNIFLTYTTPQKLLNKNSISFLPPKKVKDYHVWLIFTKVTERSPLRYKFHNLLENILNISTVSLKFHIIVDNSSKYLATNEISDVVSHSNKPIYYKFYDVEICAKAIEDIVEVLTPHFSSKPGIHTTVFKYYIYIFSILGTYYSDALFFISLGLYRIAPVSQTRAVLLDCDLYFKQDIRLLFEEFSRFKTTALYGLAPELTPVYKHVLQIYKTSEKRLQLAMKSGCGSTEKTGSVI